MAEQKFQLMFNAKNGALIGAVPSGVSTFGLDPDEIKIKTVKYDPDVYAYIGNYADGELKKISEVDQAPDAVVIDEEMLNNELKQDILHAYPIHKQLNIIIDMLNQSSVPNTPEFREMKDFVDDLRAKNKSRKEAFKSNTKSYKFVSKQDIHKSRRRRLGLD